MINEPLDVLTAFMAGLALGAVYFWTLWIAVRHLPRVRQGGLWLLSSACLRIGLLLAAWYWVADSGWERLLACLLGFLIVRFAATRWVTAGTGKRPFMS